MLTDLSEEELICLGNKAPTTYIGSWEGGIDCLTTILEPVSSKVSCSYICSRSSARLYTLSYHVGKRFMKENGIQPKGVVFNEYFLSNPLYEMNYGYIPVLYWQFNPSKE